MIFVDGVGLGEPDPETNPIAQPRPGFLRWSAGAPWTRGARHDEGDSLFRGIDACLGLDGLPQSGTGQATMLTGVNCAQLAGRHYGPYPHSATRATIREQSIFARLGATETAFANAYPPRFFDWVERMRRWPVTTRACLDAGVRIRTIEDLQAGLGVAADITGRGLSRDLRLPVTEVTPSEAAARLLKLSSQASFTLFEVFHTDKAGHAQSREAAARILDPLGGLLDALYEMRPEDVTMLLTSDHGNLEDLRVKTHTRNEVPLSVVGPGAGAFACVTDLTGIVPAIESVLSG